MSTKIYFHGAAEEEMLAAVDWYRARSVRAATLFVEEISHAVERIRSSALQFPEFVSGTRRACLQRFPFALVFRESFQGTQILAVAHAKRRPGYWRIRMRAE